VAVLQIWPKLWQRAWVQQLTSVSARSLPVS